MPCPIFISHAFHKIHEGGYNKKKKKKVFIVLQQIDTLHSFRLLILLWIVTSCYVIVSISIAITTCEPDDYMMVIS